MNESLTHSYCSHLFGLPLSVRVFFTALLLTLGTGYLFGMAQIYEVHSGRAGKAGLSVEGITEAYRGNPASSRIEGALSGPMASMLPEEERTIMINWVREGDITEVSFNKTMKPIMDTRCIACHDGSDPHKPNFSDFEHAKDVFQIDTGMSVPSLVRVSHIHLFGLTFIFGFLGMIFSRSYMKNDVLKSIILVLPFLAIFADISSWWLTKMSSSVFGYVVMGSGVLMGLSFAVQWGISLYQLWFFKSKELKNLSVSMT